MNYEQEMINDIIIEVGVIVRKIERYKNQIIYLEGQKEELLRIIEEIDKYN